MRRVKKMSQTGCRRSVYRAENLRQENKGHCRIMILSDSEKFRREKYGTQNSKFSVIIGYLKIGI